MIEHISQSNGDRIGQALFGLTTISITPELLVELSKENRIMPKDITHGLLVWKVIPGTSAFKSGLEAGDIITHVNGIPVQKPMELYNFSSSRNALEIGVINKGKQKTVTLHLRLNRSTVVRDIGAKSSSKASRLITSKSGIMVSAEISSNCSSFWSELSESEIIPTTSAITVPETQHALLTKTTKQKKIPIIISFGFYT
ncbi:hypothetical protein HUJ04_008887 [Dendroctonus ponderosae]|nr:hypothetical protein HUJ04_008887 [Dendroctonus ponderosae]